MRFIEKFFGWGTKWNGTEGVDEEPGPISYRERVRQFLGKDHLADNALLYVGVVLAYFGIDLATRYGSTPGVPASLIAIGFISLCIWSFRVGVLPLAIFFALSAFYLGSNAFYQMQDWPIYEMLHL